MSFIEDDELFDQSPMPFKCALNTLASNTDPTDDIFSDVIYIMSNSLGSSDIINIYANHVSRTEAEYKDFILKNPSHKFELKDYIRRHVDRLLTVPEWRDELIALSMTHREYASNLMFTFRHANLCRNSRGKLYDEDEIRHIVNYKRFLSSALCHGDYDAVAHILKFKYRDASIISKFDIYSLAREYSFEIHEGIYKRDKAGSDVLEYFSSLKYRSGEALRYLLENDFREDVIKQHGDIFFEELFSKDHGLSENIEQDLITKLLAAGADWYAGMSYTMSRPTMRLSIASRVKDPLGELDQLIIYRKRNPALAKAILMAQPFEMKIALCKEKGRAGDLLKITKDPALLPYVSPAKKRAFLSDALEV